MKYLIIGAGGTGGTLGFYLAKAGKDVTFIARGKHLLEIQKNGLTLERRWLKETETVPAKAFAMEQYEDTPDVVFVCVKGYSLESVIPFLRRVISPETIVIPILNIYGTGGELQKAIPECLVPDGCIYVAANITEPGRIVMLSPILRVVFGPRKPEDYRPVLEEIRDDLNDSGLVGILSDNIRRDALEKFSYVSPAGIVGLLCGCAAKEIQREGKERELFKTLVREISALAEAIGCPFEKDYVQVNLEILDSLAPETTTSMQRDILEGKPAEVEGLVYRIPVLAKEAGIRVPAYERAAEEFRARGYA